MLRPPPQCCFQSRAAVSHCCHGPDPGAVLGTRPGAGSVSSAALRCAEPRRQPGVITAVLFPGCEQYCKSPLHPQTKAKQNTHKKKTSSSRPGFLREPSKPPINCSRIGLRSIYGAVCAVEKRKAVGGSESRADSILGTDASSAGI